ncbi:hypothetical protein A2U01_0043923, partial [Trifolium medium]|nr:hypothetical protein [Trifolium medium]
MVPQAPIDQPLDAWQKLWPGLLGPALGGADHTASLMHPGRVSNSPAVSWSVSENGPLISHLRVQLVVGWDRSPGP